MSRAATAKPTAMPMIVAVGMPLSRGLSSVVSRVGVCEAIGMKVRDVDGSAVGWSWAMKRVGEGVGSIVDDES